MITFLDAASEKTLRSTVALTAARGRGKSAALGVAIAGAVALGYSNIFVTSPSPENLKTLFEFVFKGFDAMDYKVSISFNSQGALTPTQESPATPAASSQHVVDGLLNSRPESW